MFHYHTFNKTTLVFRLCITKLDILDVFPVIKICVGYKINGEPVKAYPSSAAELGSVEVSSVAVHVVISNFVTFEYCTDVISSSYFF